MLQESEDNWGEPERAPHEREVWCQDVQYICMCVCVFISYVASRASAMREGHVGAHVVYAIALALYSDCRLD